MIYHYGEFDISTAVRDLPILRRKRGNPKTRKANWNYKDVVCAFDIETTLEKTGSHNAGSARNPRFVDDFVGIMYIWQFQLGTEATIIGRTWDEFTRLIDDLEGALGDEERLLIFVHNLAYEWQWLRDQKILGARLNEESVFLVKSRTPVRFLCCHDRIEFRCSYLHSNMSLDEFTDKMEVEHGKLSGDEFDYSKKRYSWTSLTDRELEYCANDVIGLVECIYKELSVDKDTLYTIPLTSTGYVRRDVKKANRQMPHDYILRQLPDYYTYRMLREAFRGGNTHASRFYSDKRIDADITCMDISSSYPNVLVNRKFPVSSFKEIERDSLTIDHIVELVRKGRAVIARIALWNVKLRDPFWPVPYLSRDKSRNIYNADYDNGRIISAGYLETTVTDVDLRIILEEYDADIEIRDAMFASYGYIPDQIREVIREYYRRKTLLKGIKEQAVYYVKEKNKLNGIYGLTAQSPVRLEEAYIDGNYSIGIHYKDESGNRHWLSEVEAKMRDMDIIEIAHHENIEKSTMPYQWGVWCTAYARECLESMIKIAGCERFLYCDTDSCYFYGGADFHDYNEEAVNNSIKNRAFAEDIYGETHFMGVLELDKKMKSFRTMGAKKYAYIDLDDKLHITIAGVNKEKGAAELSAYAEAHQLRDGLEAMREDFRFSDAGGTESVYNDEPVDDIVVDGHHVYVPTNVAIKPSSYRIGLGEDYKEILSFLLDNDLFRLYRMNYEGYQLPNIEM